MLGAGFFSYTSIGMRDVRVEYPQDLAGLRIRTFATPHNQLLEAIGAAPVAMSGGEVYLAMQTGVIEGYFQSAVSVISRKLYEVTDYWIATPIAQNLVLYTINEQVWNKIPREYQLIMEGAATEVFRGWFPPQMEAADRWVESEAKEQGLELVILPDVGVWKEVAAAVWDLWEKDAGPEATQLIKLVNEARNWSLE